MEEKWSFMCSVNSIYMFCCFKIQFISKIQANSNKSRFDSNSVNSSNLFVCVPHRDPNPTPAPFIIRRPSPVKFPYRTDRAKTRPRLCGQRLYFLQENGTQIAITQKPVVIYRNLQFIKQLKQLLFCGILAIFCGPRHNNTHGTLQRSCGRRGSRWGIYGLTVLGHSTWPGLWTSLAGTNVFISSD